MNPFGDKSAFSRLGQIAQWRYQFHNVTPNPLWVQVGNKVYCLGFGLNVLIPPQPLDPDDYDESVIQENLRQCLTWFDDHPEVVEPVASMVWEFQGGDESIQPYARRPWTYYNLTEGQKSALRNLNVYSGWLNQLFRGKFINQVDGIAETARHFYLGNERLGSDPDRQHPAFTSFSAWMHMSAIPPFTGAYQNTLISSVRDVQYDISPTLSQGSRAPSLYHAPIPDTDWYQSAVIVHKEGQWFTIMNEADGHWVCIPHEGGRDFTLSSKSPYLDQHIKTNILPDDCQRVMPTYPSWAFVPPGTLRDAWNDRDGRDPLWPRIKWSFNKNGTKAIAMMVERKDLDRKWSYVCYNDDPPKEKMSQTKVNIKAEQRYFGPDYANDIDPVKIDRLGLVELEFTLNLDDDGHFLFDVNISRQVPPSSIGTPRWLAVAYAADTNWDRFAKGGTGTPISSIQPDDILRVDISAYVRTGSDVEKYRNTMDGCYGSELPCYAVLRFYNETSSTELLRFVTVNLQDTAEGLMRDQFFGKQFHSYISYMDLATLSFLRISSYSTRTDSETSSGSTTYCDWDVKMKNQQAAVTLYAQSYAFGVEHAHEMSGCMDQDILTDVNSTGTPPSGLELLSPNFVSTYRGYATEYERPWWMIHYPFTLVLYYSYLKWWDPETYGNLKIEDTDITPLDEITGDSFVGAYMDLVFKVKTDLQGGTKYRYSVLLDSMNKRYNPTMRTAINQFCWEWFDEVKGHLMQLVGEDEETPFSYTKVFGLFAGAYVNKLPEASLNFEVLDRAPYDEDNYDLFIRDYPFGEHWYLHMGLQALWSDDTNDQVITHLDGHVAASCTSLHAFTVPVPVVRKWFIAATNQYFYYDTKTGLGGISAQQVCRLLLDKITFWDGAYQTSHVKLTNCVAGPRYWHSKEDYIEEYSVTMNEYDEPYVLLPEAYVFFGAMNLIITAATQGGDYLVPEDQTPRLNYCQNPAFLRC